MQGSFERDLAALESVFRFTEEFTVANKVNKSVSFAMNVAIEELFTNYKTESSRIQQLYATPQKV